MDIEREMQRVRDSLEIADWYRLKGGSEDSADELENRSANLTLELNAIPIAGHLEPAVAQAVHQAVATHLQTAITACLVEDMEKITAAYRRALDERLEGIGTKLTWLLWIVLGIGPAALLF